MGYAGTLPACGCGGSPVLDKDRLCMDPKQPLMFCVRCSRCGMATRWLASSEEAAKAWRQAFGARAAENPEHEWPSYYPPNVQRRSDPQETDKERRVLNEVVSVLQRKMLGQRKVEVRDILGQHVVSLSAALELTGRPPDGDWSKPLVWLVRFTLPDGTVTEWKAPLDAWNEIGKLALDEAARLLSLLQPR